MKIENQCVSLELAKKLKDLGCKQESYFYWIEEENERFGIYGIGDANPKTYWSVPYISAFTVAELGEMLPAQLHIEVSVQHPVHQFITEKQFSQWHAVYICAGCMGKLGSQIAHTEADARAAMLVYLLENKLI